MKNRKIAWLKLLAATLLLPVVILVIGSWYMVTLSRELRLRDFETEAGELLESMRYFAATEKYLCKSISDIFDMNPGGDKLKNALEQFMKNHELQARFLVWSSDGEIYYRNFELKQIPGNWKKAWKDLRKASDSPGYAKKMPEQSVNNLRKIFGPHFFPRYHHMGYTGRFLSFLRTDVSKKRPLAWVKVDENYGLCMFLDHEILDSNCGLRNMVINEKHDLKPGYIDSGRVITGDPVLAEKLQPHIAGMQGSFSRINEFAGYKIFTNFITTDQTGFCAIESEKLESYSVSSWFTAALILSGMIILFFAVVSYRLIVIQTSVPMPLTRQLLVLFLVSNMLPGFVLLVIGSDYLQQMRRGLVNRAFEQSSSYLQNIDELYISELTVQKGRLEKGIAELLTALEKNQINRASIRGFLDKQQPQPYRFFLVASDSGIVANHRGIVKNGRVQDAFFRTFKKDEVLINTSDAVHKMCSYALNTLNQKPVSKKVATEVEFVVESLMQRTPVEMLQLFLELDSFWRWSLGVRSYPTYIRMLRVFDTKLYDYLLLYLWEAYDLELEFMTRIYHNLNRNEFGLKILAVDERFDNAFPPEALQNERIKEFLLKMRDRTITRPEFCTVDDAEFLLVGHKCIFMENLRLLALYPVEKIDSEVSGKRKLLLMFVLVSFLVSVSLGLFVSGSIIGPLAILQKGVESMQKRDFAHRLPDLGGDEFGNLARIFNETLVDLEEMHVARIVQEKIMTQMEKPRQTGNLTFYGQTISLSGMGGDYFEILESADAEPAVLLGDVAGSGVATSLILAFVHSAVMQLHKYASEPGEFLQQLNRVMVDSSSSGQRKPFACQYLSFAGDNLVRLAGAGLPYPFLIDHLKRCVSPLEIPAIPVGCSMNFKPAVSEVLLPPGHSLVCFTGGFIGHGTFDYGKMTDLIQNSVDADPQQFCQKCFDNYFAQVNRSECRNDLSLLIINNPEAVDGKQDN
ncbi:MAG: hypothetical protein CVV42_03845 [Candidatus Riflebacteria bacterium HGW-Riflebacteria-2]|jgi:HAMP domain-containing protein|nr:MAG: hypothetical protein CVV42_03845 [Candidatus Riflebacteria bacterium HGW-Riflebacteria-2]